MHQKIIGAVDPEWLEALRDPILGFMHVSPMQMLEHLDFGGALIDYMDVMELTAQLMAPWESTENPATKFARDNKIGRQLILFGLGDQSNLRLALVLAAFKGTGEYDDSIHEFEARAAPDKMLANLHPYIINEYAKKSKTNRSTAKSVCFGIANLATTNAEKEALERKERAAKMVWAVAEVANATGNAQRESMEASMKRMMEMIKEAMKAAGSKGGNSGNCSNNRNRGNKNGDKAPRAPCKHCGFKHAKANE